MSAGRILYFDLVRFCGACQQAESSTSTWYAFAGQVNNQRTLLITGGKRGAGPPWKPPAPQRFFASLDELAPNKWTQQGPFQIPDIGSATFLQMMGHEDDPLYAPFLNSHLLDNYLNGPTATLGGITLSAETSALLSNDLIATVCAGYRKSPRGTPLLGKMRTDLRLLKQQLMSSG